MQKRDLVIFSLLIVSMFIIVGCKESAVGGLTKIREESQNRQATSTWSTGVRIFPEVLPFINIVRYPNGKSYVREIRVYGLDRVEDGGNGAISLTVGERVSIMPGQTVVVNGLSIKYNSTFFGDRGVYDTKRDGRLIPNITEGVILVINPA